MDIKIPEVGESVFEALVARWLKKDGEQVAKDEPVCEIETDKVTLELNAEVDGILRIRAGEGETVKIGAVIGVVEEGGKKPERDAGEEGVEKGAREEGKAAAGKSGREKPPEERKKGGPRAGDTTEGEGAQHVSPSERKAAREQAEAGSRGPAGGEARPQGQGDEGRKRAEIPSTVRSEEPVGYGAGREERVTRKAMSPIRRRIAERLLAARQQTAMLTSFNEADLGRVMEMRTKYGEEFRERHGVKLGYMSFFVKACCEALREFPAVNARIDGDDIVYHDFIDIGIAVSGEKGLVVPVLRDADRLRFADIEEAVAGFAEKIRTNKLAVADLEGGTFTITNGGVFGSLMSTPILNPPQSGVLGMHAIQNRPVAREGQVVVRPMMYLALSYDHRIIDGREAVLFLKKVREYIEEPDEMLLEG